MALRGHGCTEYDFRLKYSLEEGIYSIPVRRLVLLLVQILPDLTEQQRRVHA